MHSTTHVAFLSHFHHPSFCSLLWYRTIPVTRKAIILSLKIGSALDEEQHYTGMFGLTKKRLLEYQESGHNIYCSGGVRFAAQAGPHAQQAGGPSHCSCCDGSVVLSHTETLAIGRSVLHPPFFVLKKGETPGKSTQFLELTRETSFWSVDLCEFY